METIVITNAAISIEELGNGERLAIEVGEYRQGERCIIEVQRRDDRYDIDDGGGAVRLADRPAGWLSAAQAVATAEGMNVNRAGRVFVQSFAGRDIAGLAERVGKLSRSVYLELLSLDD